MITKDLTTPKACRSTTLRNVSFQKFDWQTARQWQSCVRSASTSQRDRQTDRQTTYRKI